MTAIRRHLDASIGYLGLGLLMDAWNELEEIDAKDRTRPEILKLRVEVCRALENWEMMAEVSQFLAKGEPNDPSHVLNLAYAKRRFESVESAERVLKVAEAKFPDCALIQYNLGCYLAVSGRPDEARRYLSEAFKKDSGLRASALDDSDLDGIW